MYILYTFTVDNYQRLRCYIPCKPATQHADRGFC